jgi:hypothetical protein
MSSPCTDIIQSINTSWQLQLKTSLTEADLVQALALHINDLIVHDFQRLITMLYILDVSEDKLKTLLNKNKGTDAAVMIAHLVVERQKQKIKTRDLFKSRADDIPDDEKW